MSKPAYAYFIVMPRPVKKCLGIHREDGRYVFWVKIGDCSEPFSKGRQSDYNPHCPTGGYAVREIEAKVSSDRFKLGKHLEHEVFGNGQKPEQAWDSHTREFYALYADNAQQAEELSASLSKLVLAANTLVITWDDKGQKDAVEQILEALKPSTKFKADTKEKHYYTHIQARVYPSIHENAKNTGIEMVQEQGTHRYVYYVCISLSETESAEELASRGKTHNPDFYYSGCQIERTGKGPLDAQHWIYELLPPEKLGDWKLKIFADKAFAKKKRNDFRKIFEDLKTLGTIKEQDSTREDVRKILKSCGDILP